MTHLKRNVLRPRWRQSFWLGVSTFTVFDFMGGLPVKLWFGPYCDIPETLVRIEPLEFAISLS